MIKIASLLLVTLISANTFAQVVRTVTLTNGSAPPSAPVASTGVAGLVKIGGGLSVSGDGTITAAASSDVNVLSTVSQFAALTATVKSITIQDSIAGGLFNLYTGTDAIDNGMIFGDALGRKWKRFATGEKLYIRWYGLVPHGSNLTTDDAIIIRTAIAYLKGHGSEFSTIQFDACIPNTWYLIGSQIPLGGLRFYGAGGQGRNPSTLFQILTGVQPFDIRGQYAEVKDIAVRHYAGAITDSFNHTFKIRSVVNFENVNIISNSCGNGFDISGCGPNLTTSPDSIFGNPDHSIFRNCQAQFCINGAYLKGCDANAILFQNCNFAQNARWGSYDMGFLGNTYLACHFATNSQNSNSGARVVDTTFYPYPDSIYNIKGKYPPTNPTYWYKTNFTGSNLQWDSTKKYWGGGPLYANDPNSNHAVISCYTEDFEANSIISPRSVWYEGTGGSPVKGGIWEHTFGGTKFFSGTGIQADAVSTLGLHFNFTQTGANAEALVQRNFNSNGSTAYTLPLESGTLANSTIKIINRVPTITDIPYNTSLYWLNTVDNSLRLYVNKQGVLVSLLIN